MYIRYLIIALLLSASALKAGDVLDRMIATVNGRAILQSDWDDELRYECFMSGHPMRDLTAEDRRAAFERLIDQELLREQMGSTDFKPTGSEEVSTQVGELKKQYALDHSGESWDEALAKYKVTESEIAVHVELELNALRLVDARLRPSIQIDAAAVEEYYKKELLPKLPTGQQIPLQQATPKIRELLFQQKMNELLSSWLESLRAQGQIRILALEPAGPQVSQ
ncbi:MAG TPA: hypothetical protein VGU90_15110 [Terriglobales bacterium]|jgi:hypothetical protein|nr:hypothetical protein [Terriglobales bacterium]